jgi:predicted PurR-regulated permease PerM
MKSDFGDVVRVTLAVLFIGVLIIVSAWILRPFLPAIVWATMIVVPTWGTMRAVQARLWGRRALAVSVMTLALVLVFVVPLWFAIGTIVSNVDTIAAWVGRVGTYEVPPAPGWVQHLPLIGAQAAVGWNEIAAEGAPALVERVRPYSQALLRWFVAEVGGFGVLTLQFLLTAIIGAILYARGERVAAGVRLFGRRLAGERGERAVVLAGQAIRGVAFGIVVTAFVQSLFGGLGLAIAGVPFAAILTAVMFLLAVIQIGAGPVLIIATLWLFWRGEVGWGIALAVWSVLVLSMDNILRPMLIKRSANLPLLLILAGVIGGMFAFGLVGIFVGPMVLAVTYTLLATWVQEASAELPVEETSKPAGLP